MIDTNVAERLKVFIESMGLSSSQFADACGIPRPSLSQLLTGRNKKMSDVMVGQIHNMYPDLSVVWLLFGEGPMLISNSTFEKNPDNESNQVNSGLFSLDSIEPSDSKKIFFSTGGQDWNKNSKENALNGDNNSGKTADIHLEKLQNKVKELQSQIEILRKNPRKAVQITVYYDDSTFETFFPK